MTIEDMETIAQKYRDLAELGVKSDEGDYAFNMLVLASQWRMAVEVRADVGVPIDEQGNLNVRAATATDASLLKVIGEW